VGARRARPRPACAPGQHRRRDAQDPGAARRRGPHPRAGCGPRAACGASYM